MCELPSVYSDQMVKAAKPHRCCECNRTITPGEMYQRYKGCWDGKWAMYKTCVDCLDLRFEMFALYQQYEEGIEFGNLQEYVREAGLEFTVHE